MKTANPDSYFVLQISEPGDALPDPIPEWPPVEPTPVPPTTEPVPTVPPVTGFRFPTYPYNLN